MILFDEQHTAVYKSEENLQLDDCLWSVFFLDAKCLTFKTLFNFYKPASIETKNISALSSLQPLALPWQRESAGTHLHKEHQSICHCQIPLLPGAVSLGRTPAFLHSFICLPFRRIKHPLTLQEGGKLLSWQRRGTSTSWNLWNLAPDILISCFSEMFSKKKQNPKPANWCSLWPVPNLVQFGSNLKGSRKEPSSLFGG